LLKCADGLQGANKGKGHDDAQNPAIDRSQARARYPVLRCAAIVVFPHISCRYSSCRLEKSIRALEEVMK